MKFDDYKIQMTLKACCLYEQIFNKNFLKVKDGEDILELVYCCLVTSNPSLLMTYKTFLTFIDDKKVSKWITSEYEKISEFNAQIKIGGVADEKVDEEEELTITDVVSSLIIRYGVNPDYVMNQMALWEIEAYLKQADIQRRNDLIEKRFWTYLTIAPHIDGKKIKGPEDICPFEWEASKVDRAKEELDKNSAAALAFLSQFNKSQEEKKEDE